MRRPGRPVAVLFLLAVAMPGCLFTHSSSTTKTSASTTKGLAAKDREIAALTEENRRLREENEELEKDLVAAHTAIARGLVLEPREMHVPAIMGKVTAIDENLGTVTLDVGTDDGVEQGFEFTVYRDENVYVTKVVVELVRKTFSLGYSRTELEAKRPRVGDEVRTRW